MPQRSKEEQRRHDLAVSVDQDKFREWLDHPVTQWFATYLRLEREDLEQRWIQEMANKNEDMNIVRSEYNATFDAALQVEGLLDPEDARESFAVIQQSIREA